MGDKLLINCNSLSETKTLAGCFALLLRAGLVVGLTGPLGVGKSAFARFVIQSAAGAQIDVPSPTFTLVQHYETADGLPLIHMDLYRLEVPEEAFELGIEDCFYEAANLVEWPSKMGRYWPQQALDIAISFQSDEARLFTISGPVATTKMLADAAQEAGLSARFVDAGR